VASYTGAVHNDVGGAPMPSAAFGWKFRNKYGNRYVEVDLVLRNNMRSIPDVAARAAKFLPDPENPERFLDPYTDTCWQRAKGLPSYVILLHDQIDYGAEAIGENLMGDGAFRVKPKPQRTKAVR
jgi:hypothetical protein